jgi:hypothetical protein
MGSSAREEIAALTLALILTGSFLISAGTAACKTTLYVANDSFPVHPGPLPAFLDQLQILGIFEPLGDGFLNDGLHLESVLFTILVEQLLELIVNAVGNGRHATQYLPL